MKTTHFAVIPAQVRYDKTLSDKSKLLFGEIAAATNAYGVCEEDNGYFSAALQVDSRTITRCVGQLLEQGHLQRIREGNRRKLKIVTKGLALPEGADVEIEIVKPIENLEPFRELLFNLWDDGLNMIFHNKFVTQKRELYDNLLKQRLQSFSKEELLSSIKKRISYMAGSDWFKDNLEMASNIEPVIKDDASVLKWLNVQEQQSHEPVLVPMKKETLPQ